MAPGRLALCLAVLAALSILPAAQALAHGAATSASDAEAKAAASGQPVPSLFEQAMKEQVAWAQKHPTFLKSDPMWLSRHAALTVAPAAQAEAARVRAAAAAQSAHEAVIVMQQYRIQKNMARMAAMRTELEGLRRTSRGSAAAAAVTVKAPEVTEPSDAVDMEALVNALKGRQHHRQHHGNGRKLRL